MRARRTSLLAAVLAATGVVAGCRAVLGIEEGSSLSTDAAPEVLDSIVDDATTDVVELCGDGKKTGSEACDGLDLGGATCATAVAPGWIGTVGCTSTCTFNTDACSTPDTTWSDLRDTSKWSLFDVSTKNAAAKGYYGGGFDGRNVYLVPGNSGEYHGIAARYDTTDGFGASSAWSTFDISSVSAGAKGFFSSAFDGRFMYLSPVNNNVGTHGIVARYDTKTDFATPGAWTTFDISTVNTGAKGYGGSAFDGRYVYLAPGTNAAGRHGIVARYDTTAGFSTPAAWSMFDAAKLRPDARGFSGAEFDGRYVYFVPFFNGVHHGIVTRYDTTAPFTDERAWSTFNVASLHAAAQGFLGGTFDGRYLYLAPYNNGTATHGIVARYDTTAEFSQASSWLLYNLVSVHAGAKGFNGAKFDGRFVYLVPYWNTAYHGVIARYDTTAPFNTPAAWSVFDVSTLSGPARGFIGAAFDGRAIYLVPHFNSAYHGIVARFEAKSVSWLPKRWNASFY